VSDAIKALRAWLKSGLRNHGLRCVSIEEESSEARRAIAEQETQIEEDEQQEVTMPVFDVRKTDDDQRSVPPEGIYAFEVNVVPGNAGPDGMLRAMKKDMRQLMVALECSIVGGKYARRKAWLYPLVAYDDTPDDDLPDVAVGDALEDILHNIKRGQTRVRAIIDSALGLMPKDHTEAVELKREAAVENWGKLNGLVFYGETKNQPAQNGYGPKMTIDFIVTPDRENYPKKKESPIGAQSESKAVATVPLKGAPKDDMDDSILF
jgi:hypothetical protein